ncbi:uncharacterized protein K452DRAFT_52644 [Aplosporella prunicola CBS 121167]|uniref:Ubiquitin-like protease family profile domain-containing protein n=1 Tax=Aplosporella prunicola CBS 121167 TaxID=1176127 RepID=A0A6A6B9F7_9PEZI|nr:uncharacterized protein K452DRAFT_52644 [Aplosporella prunicola CBS 121167]KAF2140198.1 hypothetical protein K452DRAFT_52644 [Aplosporella prunicola CBS 121167]
MLSHTSTLPTDCDPRPKTSSTLDSPQRLLSNTSSRAIVSPPRAATSREQKLQDGHLTYHDTRKYSDASSINRLGASPFDTMSKPRTSGAFRPVNTMDQPSAYSSRADHHRSHQPHYGKQARGPYKGLQLRGTTGDNVRRESHRDLFETADDQRTPKKKRKLDHPVPAGHSRSSPVEVDLTNDDHSTTKRASSVGRVPHASNHFFKQFSEERPRPSFFELSEFQSVEERMKPSRITSSQESHQNGVTKDHPRSQNPTTHSKNLKSFSTPTRAHDESAPPPSNTHRSDVFEPPYQTFGADDEKSRSATKRIGEILHPLTDSQPISFGKRNVDIGAFDPKGVKPGKALRMPKSTEIKESDDEVQLTSPWNLKASEGKRIDTLAKGSAGIGPESFAHIPERAQGSNNGKSRLNFKGNKTRVQPQPQQTARYIWELKRLVIPGDVLKGPGLSLIADLRTSTYVAYNDDGPILQGSGKLEIDPKKINSLTYSNPCPTRFQILGSSTATEGKYQRNIEFAHEIHGKKFLEALEEDTKHTLKSHSKSPEEMERILARDLPLYVPKQTADYGGEELALLEARQRRRLSQIPDRGHESHGHNHRNQRKLVSQLGISDPSVPTTRTSRISNTNESSMPNGPEAFNPPANRSTRSRNRPDNIAIEHDQHSPEPERYSEKYGFGTPWSHPVVYPPTGRRRGTILFEDMLRLNDGEFLNDSIIAFYMTWAAIQAETQGLPKEKVYYFNTYFYTALTQTTKRGINYAAVQRWTAKFDLFSYDYVVIPVNEENHWYLAIVCNMSNINKTSQQRVEQDQPEQDDAESLAARVKKVLKSDDTSPATEQNTTEAMDIDAPSPSNADHDIPSANHSDIDGQKQMISLEKQPNDVRGHSAPINVEEPQGDDCSVNVAMASQSAKSSPTNKKGHKRKRTMPPGRLYALNEPVIVILDSLGFPHGKTARHLKEYLVEEGKSKHGLSFGVEDIKAMHSSKFIPQQSNYCDCGVFLLGYFKKFLEDPDSFIRKILTKEMSVETDWPDMDPSKLRIDIIELLKGIEKEQTHQRREEKKRRLAVKDAKQPKSSPQEPEEPQTNPRQPTPPSRRVSPEIWMKSPTKRGSAEASERKEARSSIESDRKGKQVAEDAEMLLEAQDEPPIEIPDSQPQAEQEAREAQDAWREEEPRQQKLREASPKKHHYGTHEVFEIEESQE